MTSSLGIKLCSVFVFILHSFFATGTGAFSVNYYSHNGHGAVIGSMLVHSTPSALQVADIYSRLSGLQPLLNEENVALPSRDVLAARTKQPMLLEVIGDDLPKSVRKVLSTTSSAHKPPDRGPEMKAVLEKLKARGISAEGQSYKTSDGQSLQQWIEAHAADRPVIIMHHAHSPGPAAPTANINKKSSAGNAQKRILTEETGDVPELTEFEISQYQICLWTGLAFVLLVGVSVCSIAQMEVIPDSLLYAKFQSARTGRSD